MAIFSLRLVWSVHWHRLVRPDHARDRPIIATIHDGTADALSALQSARTNDDGFRLGGGRALFREPLHA